MSLDDAVEKACQRVGIKPPKGRALGKWLKTDTLSGKNGKGDGRVIINDTHVTAHNWQTGERSTIGAGREMTMVERREAVRQIEQAKRKKIDDAVRTARLASSIIAGAAPANHAYLVAKGFRDEKALVIARDDLLRLVGERSSYLLPTAGERAIVLPARIGDKVSSVQLIWEDGTKKFLFGGTMDSASHRIATGVDTWLCEGFATGLSIRAALRGLKMRATVLCCFSAANIVAVATTIEGGRLFVGAENDKPLPQYDGLGTSEYFVRRTGLPYGIPTGVSDFNDLHQRDGIFALQRALTNIMTGRRAA